MSTFLKSTFLKSTFWKCTFLKCTFLKCTFLKCTFLKSTFLKCTFSKCTFLKCTLLKCTFFEVHIFVLLGGVRCHYCGVNQLCDIPFDSKISPSYITCPHSCMKFDGRVEIFLIFQGLYVAKNRTLIESLSSIFKNIDSERIDPFNF